MTSEILTLHQTIVDQDDIEISKLQPVFITNWEFDKFIEELRRHNYFSLVTKGPDIHVRIR